MDESPIAIGFVTGASDSDLRYLRQMGVTDVVSSLRGVESGAVWGFEPMLALKNKVENAALSLVSESGLAWFASSGQARRGFCRTCGASLFWQPSGAQTTSIAAGTLDPPSGLVTIGHIFTAEKGDFYNIADDLKQFPGSAGGKMDTSGA